ncbi:hypothetical protein [Chryseobacterium vrystaatense]|uniref:Phage shock protein B n=1 Tax=Chryseobacterium vrystaatense TaxID=307480 RepID=A0A1M4ZIH2_9FLAO|nr:hypothetical protein [Chryseobacterium vrystaatense]SHF17775.1 hypothetical protein SAMN02787073_1606 [Chryseobacterium vrystaatense]
MTTTEIILLSLNMITILPLILILVESGKQRKITEKFSKLTDQQSEHIKRLQNDYNSLSDSYKKLADKYQNLQNQ